jgi:integrase
MTNIKIDTGFDRGLDYIDIKKRLVDDYKKKYDELDNSVILMGNQKILCNQIIYLILSLIQLRNGSRSIEAVWAFRNFIKKRNFNDTILVKIAKSESFKYDRKTKEKYKTKIRHRKIVFPISWINFDTETIDNIEMKSSIISDNRLKKRTLDYLLKYHDCNTHSLRYCFINYMINEKKVPLNDVAKTVGHVDLSMLTRYTQAKNIDKVLALDD